MRLRQIHGGQSSVDRRRIESMNNKGQDNTRDTRFRELLGGYLRVGASSSEFGESDHLDGDVIAAFVEGNLSQREAGPITTHLVDCSFCRHKTADLVRLDLQFAEESTETAAPVSEPTRVADVLSGILGRIFGSAEGAVFAHEERIDESDPEPAAKEEEE